jgi:hypothetical protein
MTTSQVFYSCVNITFLLFLQYWYLRQGLCGPEWPQAGDTLASASQVPLHRVLDSHFFFLRLGFELRLHTCKEGPLPFDLHLQYSALIIWEIGFQKLFAWLVLNHKSSPSQPPK